MFWVLFCVLGSLCFCGNGRRSVSFGSSLQAGEDGFLLKCTGGFVGGRAQPFPPFLFWVMFVLYSFTVKSVAFACHL